MFNRISRMRAGLVAALLSLSLAALLAPVAMAAPKSVKPNGTLSLCSSVVTRSTGPISYGTNLDVYTVVQELKNSDGTSCNEYRSIMYFRLDSLYQSTLVQMRYTGLMWWYQGATINSSVALSYTHLTATSSWQSYIGPWATICSGGFQAFAQAQDGWGSLPTAYTGQVLPTAC